MRLTCYKILDEYVDTRIQTHVTLARIQVQAQTRTQSHRKSDETDWLDLCLVYLPQDVLNTDIYLQNTKEYYNSKY